jgi:hypothetical protein
MVVVQNGGDFVDVILLYFAVKASYQPRVIIVSRSLTRGIAITLKPKFQFTLHIDNHYVAGCHLI